jgi:hypothetical protein
MRLVERSRRPAGHTLATLGVSRPTPHAGTSRRLFARPVPHGSLCGVESVDERSSFAPRASACCGPFALESRVPEGVVSDVLLFDRLLLTRTPASPSSRTAMFRSPVEGLRRAHALLMRADSTKLILAGSQGVSSKWPEAVIPGGTQNRHWCLPCRSRRGEPQDGIGQTRRASSTCPGGARSRSRTGRGYGNCHASPRRARSVCEIPHGI